MVDSLNQLNKSLTTIYMPSIEACESFGINRLPKNYGTKSKGGGNNPVASVLGNAIAQGITTALNKGPQYQRLGDLGGGKFWSTKQTMAVPDINTRDVIVEILGNQPYTIKTVSNPDGTVTSEYDYGKSGPPAPQAIFHITPTDPGGSPYEMEFNHEHDWNAQGDLFSSLLKKGSEIVGDVEALLTKTKNAVGKQGAAGFKAQQIRQNDTAETYQATKKQEITIPFTLFTKGGYENFNRDIYDPLMTLLKYSYPKRSKDFAPMLGNVLDSQLLAGSGFSPTSPAALDALNSISPGFRVYISDPPSYINVRDGAGLFSYKNCFIKSLKYKFKHFVDGSGRPTSVIENSKSNLLIHRNGPTVVPCIAECVLTIGTSEPLFSDDFTATTGSRNAQATTGGGIGRVISG